MIIFKFPDQEQIFTLDPRFEEYPISFFSFEGQEKLKFKGRITPISEAEIHHLNFNLPASPENMPADESHEAYLEKIEKAVSFVKKHNLAKIVIARKKTVHFEDLDFTGSFLQLCRKYPQAFVYAFEKEGEAWMGAFAEVLGIYDKKTSVFTTMSLAGTLPLEEEWTAKELEEQQPVTDYINRVLAKYGSQIYQSERYDQPSGNIKHLRTDLKYTIPEEKLDAALSDLHPTPAVGGDPKDFCLPVIRELEGFDRELYAGYSRINTGDRISCYISLRCGKFFKNQVQLFAGGGITAFSDPEKEWRETELKMQATGNNLLATQIFSDGTQ